MSSEAPRPSRPRRDVRGSERALFLSFSLFIVTAAVAGHQYFGSDAGRARRLVRESREGSSAQALRALGCRDPKVLAPAAAAQLAHLGQLRGITPVVGASLALCDLPSGSARGCERVAEAFERAGGALPVQAVVVGEAGVVCSALRRREPSPRVVE